MQYNLAVFIGRFQPFHNGHLFAVREGLKIADKVLMVLGDTGGPRGLKNPWTSAERIEMIRSGLEPSELARVEFATAYDDPSDTLWASDVADSVVDYEHDDSKIVLIGHQKDSSSFYLKMFPQWRFLDTGYETLVNGVEMRYNATDIRKMFWEGKDHYMSKLIPDGVFNYIVTTWLPQHTPSYVALVQEYRDIQKYRESWAGSPFPPMFVTTDAVVIQSSHILLVKRKENPGKGLWALPGGFLGQTETLIDGALRELREETNIKLQDEVLKRCLSATFVEDRAGGVSEEDRGRIITHVHVFRLNDDKPLPRVTGGDDAEKAAWVPIRDINFRYIFSDHGKIISRALKLV